MSESLWQSRPADLYGRRKRDRLVTVFWGLSRLFSVIVAASRWTPAKVVPKPTPETSVPRNSSAVLPASRPPSVTATPRARLPVPSVSRTAGERRRSSSTMVAAVAVSSATSSPPTSADSKPLALRTTEGMSEK